MAITATDLAEIIGSATAMNLLFGLPLWIGVLITAADVLLILFFGTHNFRLLRGENCFPKLSIPFPSRIAVCSSHAPNLADILLKQQIFMERKQCSHRALAREVSYGASRECHGYWLLSGARPPLKVLTSERRMWHRRLLVFALVALVAGIFTYELAAVDANWCACI